MLSKKIFLFLRTHIEAFCDEISWYLEFALKCHEEKKQERMSKWEAKERERRGGGGRGGGRGSGR